MKRSSVRTFFIVSILMILAVAVAAYPSGPFPEGEETAPADPERNSTLEEGKLGVLVPVGRETILGLLREQEDNLLGGLWIYTVRGSSGEDLPEEFSEETFAGGLARLKAKPSFLGQGVLNTSEMERIAAALESPGSTMIVLLRGEGYMKLLAPLQMYGLDAEGRECHEFTRYYVTDAGRLLSQEIVRRVYIPGQGGRKLVTTEVISSTPTTEMWVRRDPYGRNTREAGLTAWQFGLGFDAEPTSGSRTVSQGLGEWDAIHWSYELNPEADPTLPLEKTPTVFTFLPERRGSAPDGSEDEVAYIQLDYRPSDPNLFLRPLVMGWASVGSSSVKYLFVDSWLESPEGDDSLGDGNGAKTPAPLMSEDAPTSASARPVVPKTARMSETRESAVPGAESEAVYDYDLILFNADDAIDPGIFENTTPTGTKVHDETLNLDLTLGEDPMAVFASPPPNGEDKQYVVDPKCTQFYMAYKYGQSDIGDIADMNNTIRVYRKFNPWEKDPPGGDFDDPDYYGPNTYGAWVGDFDYYKVWSYTNNRYEPVEGYAGQDGDGSFASWVHLDFAVPIPDEYPLIAHYIDDNIPKCANDGPFSREATLYLFDVQIDEIAPEDLFLPIDPDYAGLTISATVTPPSVPGTYSWSSSMSPNSIERSVRFKVPGQSEPQDTAVGQSVTIVGNVATYLAPFEATVTVKFTADADSLNLVEYDTDSIELPVYGMKTILLRRYGSGGTFASACGYSVGGKDSDIHKAEVQLTMMPPNQGHDVSLPVYMEWGGGNPAAKLTVGEGDDQVVLSGNSTSPVRVKFKQTSVITGILDSSNLIIAVHLKGYWADDTWANPGLGVFEWPNYNIWNPSPYYVDETYTPVSVRPTFDLSPTGPIMDKHNLRFYAYEVSGQMWVNHQYVGFILDYDTIDLSTGLAYTNFNQFSEFSNTGAIGGDDVATDSVTPGTYKTWQVVHTDPDGWWHINDVKFVAVDSEVEEP